MVVDKSKLYLVIVLFLLHSLLYVSENYQALSKFYLRGCCL